MDSSAPAMTSIIYSCLWLGPCNPHGD